jgi:hypothetical protein
MAVDIGRREFISVLGGVAVLAGDVPIMMVCARPALARAPDEMPRVILLTAGDEADLAARSFVAAFEQGMRTAGWSAGVNVTRDPPKFIEHRDKKWRIAWTGGHAAEPIGPPRLLRHGSERPCDTRAHKRDEFAPPHRSPRAETLLCLAG